MGRKSIRENKNVYQITREELGLTREEADELLDGISDDRIAKIESGKFEPHPDEIMIMAHGYKKPELALNYCSSECPIGQKYIPEIKPAELSQIVLEILDSSNALSAERDRLISITVDGKITPDEYEDYDRIQNTLKRIAAASSALEIWMEKQEPK